MNVLVTFTLDTYIAHYSEVLFDPEGLRVPMILRALPASQSLSCHECPAEARIVFPVCVKPEGSSTR